MARQWPNMEARPSTVPGTGPRVGERAGAGGGTNGWIGLEARQSGLESECRSNLPNLLPFFFFSLHTESTLCLYSSAVLEAESRGASICGQSCYLRTSILYKGSLYVKQKHFCFCLSAGVSGKNWLVFPSKWKDQTQRLPKCWVCLSVPSWNKAWCGYSALYLSLIKALLPFELLHRIPFCRARSLAWL